VFLLALALAGLVGLSLGLLGGGGSILAVPIVRYVLGLEAHQAIALRYSWVAQRVSPRSFRMP
jgi:uncharacterized membrane protein YfcA